jgi:hypothetical protein
MRTRKPRVHLRDAGCTWSRNTNYDMTDRHANVTCPSCRRVIKRLGLRDRQEFPEVPEFTVTAIRGRTLGFRCPCCGVMNYHGGGDHPGDGDGHRGAHCRCWPHGYSIVEVLPGAEQTTEPQPSIANRHNS